jgi:hypothetical protein
MYLAVAAVGKPEEQRSDEFVSVSFMIVNMDTCKLMRCKSRRSKWDRFGEKVSMFIAMQL